MKRLFGINSDCIKDVDEIKVLEIIKKVGFSSFFTDTCNNEKVKNIKAKADDLGLTLEFLHAPSRGINAMWEEGDGYLGIYNGMIEAIDSASANNVPAVIIHTSSGWTPPLLNDIGFSRYDKIVDYAKEKGVTLAFENLRSLSHVAFVVYRYRENENVRFCYDFGHEHCYTNTIKWPNIFTDKIICTHIHDNHGYFKGKDGDEHLLPYDGTIDYKSCISLLDKYNYKGSLMLEVFNSISENYLKLSIEEFIQLAYDRLEKLSKA